MGLTAVHPDRGRLDATLPDLGCAWHWEAIHRSRPPAALTCPECGHRVQAKLSPLKLRYFAHFPGADLCALAEESMAHHLLKLELATSARHAGWEAELEVSGPGGVWRADVLAAAGDRRVALEAQLAPITPDHILGRTERMAADAVPAVWFSDRPRPPWLGVVPSVRLAPAAAGLAVVEGLGVFADSTWTPSPPIPLTRFMTRLRTGELSPHRPTFPMATPARALATVFTTTAHITAERSCAERQEQEKREAADRRELERQAAIERARGKGRDLELQQLRAAYRKDEKERQREEQEQQAAEDRRHGARDDIRLTELLARNDHTRQALVRHSTRLPGIREAIARLTREHGVAVRIGDSVGDSRYAAGIPLVATDGSLLGVFDPLPQSSSHCAFLRDVGARLVFPAEERRARFIDLLRQDPPTLDYWTAVVRPRDAR
ncbi:competence protein CoiA [Streptomyces sp. 5.8]|uniref:competence protein CoiA n=1 Tax=Streptomyces sp. 5.8 TaxID=3406571 RepID=UPI003BB53904